MSDAAVQLSPGDWSAPLAPASSEAAGKNALVHIPGSKSLTNRYLLLAALADSPSYLRAPLHSRDSALMIEALRQLVRVLSWCRPIRRSVRMLRSLP